MRLEPRGVAATEVTIELRQERGPLGSAVHGSGSSRASAAHMVRRAAAATLEEALDGLERISAGTQVADDG